MADVTGALHHDFGGKTYTLRLTMATLGKLQGVHGNDLGGLLTGKAEGVLSFTMLVDIVAAGLQKGGGADAETSGELADEMLTADQGIVTRLMEASFPALTNAGNVKAPKAKR